jgi:hypothetical protein
MARMGLVVAAVMAVVLSASAVGDVFAQEAETKPIQLSLFDPIQIFDREQSIKGLRLNLIYGLNADVTGIDLGLVNRASGTVKGIQWGFVNYNDGDFTGWNDGAVNVLGGKMTGFQDGLANITGGVHGVQLGWLFNKCEGEMSGLQIGLINMTDTANGLQIGLINVINSGSHFKFFPIVNWSFN